MAEFYSSVAGLQTFSSSEEQRSSATPKLRDSCDACASSKLKCHKQKPICSRCAKRGITCSYVATRRKGRKSASQSSQSSQSTTQEKQRSDASPPGTLTAAVSPSLDMWFATDAAFSNEDYLAQSSGFTSGTSISGASSTLPSDGLLSMQSSDLMTDIDDYFPSLGSPFTQDTINCDFSSQTHSFFIDIGHGKNDTAGFLGPLSLFENSITELPSLPGTRTNKAPGACIAGPESSCIFQAIDLMKQLFPNSSSSCKNSESMENVNGPSTTQNVLDTNQRTIEVVNEILRCSCSQDSFILAIISLIMFKMLNWYAAAARQAPLWSGDYGGGSESPRSFNSINQISPELVLPDPAGPSSPGLEGEDPALMAAQRVLSELHWVQRLVNQLSTKIKENISSSSGTAGDQTPGPSEHGYGESSLPFSASMLDQLDVDLRKRLKLLSREVVALLRRE